MSTDLSMECKDLGHWFGDSKILFDVNFKIARGQIVGLIGPSGCGKSTLFRSIIGTHLPKNGNTIVYTGKDNKESIVTRPGRDRGIVYQKYTLFPYLTAVENIAFGLMLDKTNIPFRVFNYFKWKKVKKQFIGEAEAFLEKMNLVNVRDKYPHELSGGMSQRVAIAQALILKPEILLLDEPFGALDESTREGLQRMLLSLYEENITAKKNGERPPYTIVMVTHELNEALYVGDRVMGLSQYWKWENEFEKFPGATIVYDKVSPVFDPREAKDVEYFIDQKDEIKDVVFNKDVRLGRHDHVKFWDQVKNGESDGILSIKETTNV